MAIIIDITCKHNDTLRPENCWFRGTWDTSFRMLEPDTGGLERFAAWSVLRSDTSKPKLIAGLKHPSICKVDLHHLLTMDLPAFLVA